MIATTLKADIEAYAVRARTTNPLFTRARAGELTPAHLTRYLTSIRALVVHTPRHLARARDAAERRGQRALAAHYRARLLEENGHDAWASRDLARVQGGAHVSQAEVLRSMGTLLAFVEDVIDEDPALYLAYILFAEYLTVLLGPEWLALVEHRCGIPRTALTVVGNHAELDREHVASAIAVMATLVGERADPQRFRDVLAASMDHFERFCAEATTLGGA